MKKSLFFAVLLFIAAPEVFAQWQVTGGYVGVNATTKTFKCTGEIRVGSGATFKNLGTVLCTNLKTDAGGTARGTGLYTLSGSLTNLGTILDNTKFTLNGATAATVTTTGDALYQLTLSKTGAGTSVTLADPLTINNKLTISGANNKLVIGNHDLTFATAATIASIAQTNTNVKFIVTNGTGRVVKNGLNATPFFFPIGATATTYNPLRITNIGTADNIGVRALPDALSAGDTGAPLASDAVAASWQVTEGTLGGSNLTLESNWLAADELPGFDRTACAIRHWNGAAWDSQALGAAAGTGAAATPFNRTRPGVSTLGYFSVLDGAFPQPPTWLRDDSKFSMEMFPNPASERVFVRSNLPNAHMLRVFDAAGRAVFSLKNPALADGLWLDVFDFASGVFQVEISNRAGERLVDRFLKKSE